MVLGSTSPTATPPEVTTASSTGRGPVRGTVKSFSVSSKARRCSLRRLWALASPGTPDRAPITGIRLRGTSPPATLEKSWLARSLNSRTRRASRVCSSRAGFRSMWAV